MAENPGNSFTLLSLVYCILITCVYFSKPRIKTLENKIYSKVLITCLTGCIFSVGTYYFMKNMDTFPILNEIFARGYLIFVATFTSLITYYVLAISISEKNMSKVKLKYLKWSKIFALLFYCILCISSIILPIEYYNQDAVYSSGTAVNFLFISTRIYAGMWILVLLLQVKRIKEKKYWPMILYILLGGTISYIQNSHPEYLLATSMIVFVTILMYFTIENPDVKLINELNIAKTQAEKANNAKTEFLSNMSHEIRTPLNAVVGFSESLLEENISDSAKEQAKDIVNASESLLEIVNGILDISKIEANKLEIIESEYSFKKIYDDLVTICKSKLSDKNIEFIENYDASIPDVFCGDYVRVKQIILNLLTNAIKYTKEGKIEFKVSNVINGDDCKLIVSVEDTGIGIKKENINKLFTKFERLQVEKSTTVEGTGLGLAITKKLVELMNGKITVQSTFGSGSKFTIILTQKIIKNKKLEEEKVIFEYIDLSSKKVLVVDDNEINLKVATRLLKNYDVVPDQCKSGSECIDKLNDNIKYDLILLDDMMPNMSGTETLKKLKMIDGFDIPVVALTANAISGMKEKYLSLGFDDYLSKPIDRKELDRVLKKYLL